MAIDPLKPLNPRQWDEKKAKHLLSRAGFGIPRERLTHLANIGLHKAVDALVDFDSIPPIRRRAILSNPAGRI